MGASSFSRTMSRNGRDEGKRHELARLTARPKIPPPKSRSGNRFTARMRDVSERRELQLSRSIAGGIADGRGASAIGEAIACAVECLNRSELRVDLPKFPAHAFYMTVYSPVIDEDIVRISGVHQLIAALDNARTCCQRFKDEEFGDR